MNKRFKYIVLILSIISTLYYFLVISVWQTPFVVFRYSFFELLHEINFYVFFPILVTFAIMYFYNKKKNSDLLDYFSLWVIIFFLSLGFNGLLDFLSFDFCKTEEVETLYKNKFNSKSIVYMEEGCGIFDVDNNYIKLKSPYLFIFNKYEEVDTNTIDLMNWNKL